MSTRTIEPIHIVLPDADGGYYRFGELPRLIAEALKPDTEEADADPQGDYYVFRALDQMDYEKDLPQAAARPPGEPGYLHVVENSASKRPLDWRMGAVLNAGLVHLDWLNEWGESRKPPLVFSTIAAPKPQAATPAPVADSASNDATPDPERRLTRLRQLGGNVTFRRGEWKCTGITALVAIEKSEGRKRSDEQTIRGDLKEAAQNEREARRAGFGAGLGQR
ncbi:hypothetical protein [Diaphorobacter sp.]|uniref:hypothetical protein n=1 Tax=Diaphorobacter sp. TaxID=1934310 RepID=UPI00258BE123|nr:hypothetical protein [Diaphorobacter sp.]